MSGRVPSLSAGELHLWAVQLDGAHGSDGLLSAVERRRIGQIRSGVHRRRAAAARTQLRRILGGYLDRAPDSVEFVDTDYGRPTLAAGAPIQFNVSRSQGIAIVAVATGSCVGVDLEAIEPLRELEALARLSMTAAELFAFTRLPPWARTAAFYHAWTGKESYAKALGMGTSIRFADIQTWIDPQCSRGFQRVSHPRGPCLSTHHLAPAVGFCGAVTAPGDDWHLQRWRW